MKETMYHPVRNTNTKKNQTPRCILDVSHEKQEKSVIAKAGMLSWVGFLDSPTDY